MGRFNVGANKGKNPGPKSAIKSKTVGRVAERARTALGAVGYRREAQSELFLLAVSFMGGDKLLHESEENRYKRLVKLCNEESVFSDEVWAYNFVNYLRNDAQLRTVAIVVACEIVRARLANNLFGDVALNYGIRTPRNRQIIDVACARADEPAEVLAYWTSKYGQSKYDGVQIPQPILNGVGDAAVRLWNEFSVLKYGGGNGKNTAVTMKDVLRLARPTPKDAKQAALFGWITGTTPVSNVELSTGVGPLEMITARQRLNAMPRELRVLDGSTSEAFKNAGMTWENVSEWYPGGMSGQAWDAVIPNMGFTALIRNLRNFDEKGISQLSVDLVIAKLTNAVEVAKSRVFPYQLYQAYRSVAGFRWSVALETALNLSLSNIPVLSGQSLVLVDRSGSMFDSKVSDRSVITFADVASLFGAAWKLRNLEYTDLYQFGSEYKEISTGRYLDHKRMNFRDYSARGMAWEGVTKRVDMNSGSALLRGMEKFQNMGGTELYKAVEETYRPGHHKRVIIITDEQANGYFGGFGIPYQTRDTYYDDLPGIDKGTPVYIWNLAGYQAGVTKSGRYRRHTFGGLTDGAFKQIPILESGVDSGWPWQ